MLEHIARNFLFKLLGRAAEEGNNGYANLQFFLISVYNNSYARNMAGPNCVQN
jgi:hypothetical protein